MLAHMHNVKKLWKLLTGRFFTERAVTVSAGMISEVVTSKIIHTSTIAEVPDQPRAVPAVVGFARLPYRGFYVTSVVRPRASACETTEGDDALISSIQPEGYIRATETYSWKDQWGRNKTGRTEWESRDLSGGFREWNTVERAIKTEIDTRTE